MDYQKLVEHFSVKKTTISDIMKDRKNLRRDYEFFKGSYKKCRHRMYHAINEILYKWYRNCTSANVFPNGPILQEEAIETSKRLEKEELTNFTASNGWLEKWKQIYGVREKRLCGKTDEVSTTTVQAWIGQLLELCQDYEPRIISNLYELGLFFKALSEKVLMEKGKTTNGGKKSKQCMTLMFVVASDGSFIFEPSVIWRSKGRRCFKCLKIH